MPEHEFGTPSLYVEHLPDSGPADTHPRPDSVERGAGQVEVGVEVDGVRIPLARRKAGGVLDDLRRAKENQQGEQTAQQG